MLPHDVTRCFGDKLDEFGNLHTCPHLDDCERAAIGKSGPRTIHVDWMCATPEFEHRIRPGVDIDAVHRRKGA